MQKIIIDLYQKGFSIEQIQKELTVFFSSDKIRKTLQENNIQLRTLEEAKKVQIDFEERKYPVDDDYLLESHNGAIKLGRKCLGVMKEKSERLHIKRLFYLILLFRKSLSSLTLKYTGF